MLSFYTSYLLQLPLHLGGSDMTTIENCEIDLQSETVAISSVINLNV